MTEKELARIERCAFEMAGMHYTGMAPKEVRAVFALARVGLAVTPRPISEAPKNEYCLLFFDGELEYTPVVRTRVMWKNHKGEPTLEWVDQYAQATQCRPNHFIPLSALPKPGGE